MIKIQDDKIIYVEDDKIDRKNHFRSFKIEDFTSLLASDSAYPGGGAVAGLNASQGFALISMVCNLTIGKKKFAEFEEELITIKENAEQSYDRMLDLIQLDSINFEPLAKAYALPHSTEKDKEYRKNIMDKAIVQACLVPIEVADSSYKALDTLNRLKDISSILVISDVGVALENFISAIRSSVLNIYINLKILNDEKNTEIIQNFVDEVYFDYQKKYEEINNYILSKIK